ncbi:MAG: repair protein RecN [Epulopiscium sp.]|jgi:DNA repair protein RecN (Recombination protein N)|uniref:DNA repair protein RecN n=1 Tax=Defluviitalea raffinosedens TaxID=1450156 RepID=A0A7C8LGZ6_9FIRM|nr:DNA repair protein RecN [Defluviitalea raffinosedens]MBZ4669122.1 repair protein RecN [Defluviitaleaceae bacterium]MDK2789109.1 repair protein RecN [Candidatus Epulonipiscium sp.]KAE9637219.1 DNA repair protein RecN [Defluviitalea raffinosedens]MBM7685519.1 DNA repair protein RecN (Recombination protein N) [Defluviitalea raffinosedens]HHW66752.1 DNA repair protein RecN [Candidatus Epulonipiscium sp.]
MLIHIYIKNIALIDEITLDFDECLNILTGETGAGKSILIDSINFALGERTSKEMIRSGESNALVELLFFLRKDEAVDLLKDMGIHLEEDRYLLISRSINQTGRNICRINGQTVTLGMLRQVSNLLIDVHGQHQHQSLLNVGKHIELLDEFCKDVLKDYKNRLSQYYKEYKAIEKQMENLIVDEKEKERKIDLLKFQIDEISDAKLKKNEDELLQSQLKILYNSEKLTKGIDHAYTLLYDNAFKGSSAYDNLGEVSKILKDLSGIDSELLPAYETAENLLIQLEDLSRDIRNYREKIDHNPEELQDAEKRLDLIYNLKRKYGNTIDEILEYKGKIEEELNFIINSDEKRKQLHKEYLELEKKITDLCKKISDIRKEKAKIIENSIEKVLHELEMKEAKFSIHFSQKEHFNDNGWDQVEFMISTNPGEGIKPLSKIASGGEMSRIMLALKSVLADIDEIDTLIFDEIDTGISGRTAQKVAEKLGFISRKHQVICITHLPQIAAMADQHYRIEKKVENEKTISSVQVLDNQQIITELARLTSGASITDITLKNAEEMKKMADELKVNFG